MLDSNYLLTDEQMLQFITKGFLVLQNDLPFQLHNRIMKQIHYVLHNEGNPGNNILPRVPDIQQLFETPIVKGALSSVLGPDYYMHPHRHCHYNRPGSEMPGGGQWHKDGYWSAMRSHRPWWAMVFYYTQDVTEELGPTAIMPGSQYYEKFLGERGETYLPTGKAGTMVLVHFDLWHKASLNISNIDRYMLKFQFLRLQAPTSPSWNHQQKELLIPEGLPAVHKTLWQDVWQWLRGDDASKQVRQVASEERLVALRQQLENEDPFNRGCAADELGLLGVEAASCASSLAPLVNDHTETTALNAAYALGQLGTPGVGALIQQMTVGSKLAAERAAYGLHGAGVQAIPQLLRMLHHEDQHRRALAVFVLGMIGSSEGEVVSSLISSLHDESEWVRRHAVEALGLLKHPGEHAVSAIAKVLLASLQDELNADTLHKESTKPNANFQPYITNKIGYAAALSLLRIGQTGQVDQVDETVHSLEQALRSKDRYVRAYAMEALSHLRTEEAVDILIRFIRSARWCPDTSKASTF
ncbi:HEAT repeat domain-containing protein [Paenibacillus qinlingensis]|uniref:HEAT repeat protein n=1 Tax=Paenibacillus qinlingensis TaxID=1837343 RepID=A0ABU1NUL4_9BACL|nr:HEAT repeat domain-containing protein [Paenibacillus qinlingensis]MDR6550522.1 HEAT repeat protein [Paenibacillus qinlingensis]